MTSSCMYATKHKWLNRTVKVTCRIDFSVIDLSSPKVDFFASSCFNERELREFAEDVCCSAFREASDEEVGQTPHPSVL